MILVSPEGPEAQERCKWEAQQTAFGPGLKPYVFQPYPKMLYRAGRSASGVPCIIDSHEVGSAQQEANLLSRGYREGQDTALAHLHAQDQEAAVLAANRAFTDRRMSAQAQEEAARIDATSSSHLPVIPEQPVTRRRGKHTPPQEGQ